MVFLFIFFHQFFLFIFQILKGFFPLLQLNSQRSIISVKILSNRITSGNMDIGFIIFFNNQRFQIRNFFFQKFNMIFQLLNMVIMSYLGLFDIRVSSVLVSSFFISQNQMLFSLFRDFILKSF